MNGQSELQGLFGIANIPHRNLSYTVEKFAMMLPSLDIHGLKVSRINLVLFSPNKQLALYLSHTVLDSRGHHPIQ